VQPLKLFGMAAIAAAMLATQAVAAGPTSVSRALPNSVTFPDSTGENPTGGPDIARVVASNNDAGQISFEIGLPNRTSLPPEMLVNVDIDADNNPATGDPETLGADYAIEFFQGQANLFKWDGTNFTRRQGDPAQVSLITSATAASLTISINAAELNATKRFNFGVIVITGIVVNQQTGDLAFENARFDLAPDAGHGLWNFQVRTAPLRLVARRFNAGRPVAGRLHTVRMVAARSDTGAVLTGGQVRCAATIAGRRVAAKVHKFVGQEARCAWQIPSGARGGTIRGSITVVFEGLTVRRSFSATIR
jgi:hypothetical protein